jgi:hypothetical protein
MKLPQPAVFAGFLSYHHLVQDTKTDEWRRRTPEVPGPASGSYWLWVLPLIIAAAAVGIAGWRGHWWSGGAKPAALSSTGPITGRSLLDADDKLPYVGRTVEFEGVTVQAKAGTQVVFVGPDIAQQLLVVLPGDNSGISAGGTLSFSGAVRRAPNSEGAQAEWNLTDSQVYVLQATGVYVQATAVQRH